MAETTLKDKIPPHDDEAERATLGAVLLDSESLGVVLKYLRPEDFYSGAHKKIFQSIIDLFNRGEAIDLITLTDDLRSSGNLDKVGGPGYVSTLTSVVPTSANVEYYARIVQDASARRTLARIATDLVASSRDDTQDCRELVEEAERKIFDITDRYQSGSYRNAGEIVSVTIEAIEKLIHSKDSYTGIPSGYPGLDSMTSGFQNAEFIVLGARPSVGKTALALNMAANMAIHRKIPVGFFTLEMSAMALMQRLLSSEARLNSQHLRTGLIKPSDVHHLMEAAGKIYEAPLYIDDSPNIKLLDLRAQARRMKAHEDIKILFIDYIGLIEPETRGNVPRHEQVAEISRSIKALARELNIPIVCLSQVGRQSEGKPPSLADLRESGSIEQDADVVMFLHRERGTEKEEEQNSLVTDLIVAKQRNGPVGPTQLAFLKEYTKFEQLTKEYA
ncbi:MAG: replicative DNA helicase [Spirochaetales bacterium]|nr:replicative DNA helicase [Spirochaetales bacterium]